MNFQKRVKTFFMSALCATGIVSAAVAQDTLPVQPYNITVGVGSTVSEVRFNWFSGSPATPLVQLAKTSDVRKDHFPARSDYRGVALSVSATEGVRNNPANVEKATGEYAAKVTVGDLTAGTSYSYRVGDGKNWSNIHTFKTGKDNRAGFAVFGDPQLGASGDLEHDRAGWAKTLEAVMKNHPGTDFLLSLGDEVNDYDSLAKQQSEYTVFINPDSSKDYIQSHELAVLEGNHDHQMGRYYSFHYNLPNVSALGQTANNNSLNNDGDYWFTYGPVLFLMLEGNSFYDTAAPAQFMEKAIAANKGAKWTVAAFHQSPYSEANHAAANKPDDDVLFIRQNWPKLMDTYHVDVVFNGHDHYYTRTWQMFGGAPVDTIKTNAVTNPKGTVYITLDSGTGSKYYQYNTGSDHSFRAAGWQNNKPMYAFVTVTNSRFAITTYETDTGSVIDTYAIDKK